MDSKDQIPGPSFATACLEMAGRGIIFAIFCLLGDIGDSGTCYKKESMLLSFTGICAGHLANIYIYIQREREREGYQAYA